MREKTVRAVCRLLTLVLVSGALAVCQPPTQPYAWKNVQIVGGGFVSGIIFHPTAPGIRYARTDMGGAYRWDAAGERWQPMLDWLSRADMNLVGVASIAVDPADANRVYLACGTYTNARAPNGAILRSDDGGRTFKRTDLPFKMGSNEDGRGNGERLAVDPGDGQILFLGTRHNGLWRSQDRGVRWSQVAAFPDVTEPAPPLPAPIHGETLEQRWRRMPVRGDGIVFVKFVPGASAASAATQTIYVGVSLMNRANLFVSRDAGASWSAVEGAPVQYRPTRAALSSDGFLYVAYGTAPGPSRMTNGAVWKIDTRSGQCSDITPEHPVAGSRAFGYAAVAVDARHPRTLIASTYGYPGVDGIFRSTDGGASWKAILTPGHSQASDHNQFDYSGAPYVKATPVHWLFDIEIDPTDSNHAVFTTGYGGWETFDLGAAEANKPVHWRILARGIEETVALGLDSPARGAHLITAIGDYGGFAHWDLDRAAEAGSSAPPRMANTTGIASAARAPRTVVRVGIAADYRAPGNLGYSLDSGRTWQAAATLPQPASRAGAVAVSADGRTWIWTPEREAAYVTRDRGASWTETRGLPTGLRVIADPVDANSFYAVSISEGIIYRSSDGGASFSAEKFTASDRAAISTNGDRGDPRGGQDQLYAAPGRRGDLWLAAFDGLYHAGDLSSAGVSLARMPDVTEIEAFGFGKPAPHQKYPALYLAGTIDGQSGVFRSIDAARNWTRINDDQHQWGLILQISGDPRIYGRVYVGTHGRGVLYGDPASAAHR